MIGYPNCKKKSTAPSKANSQSRRGMPLEDEINTTNRYYLDQDRAAVYKKPIPINIVKVQYQSRQTAKITEAYYQMPSTTDYNGIYQSQYLDFEAKQTDSKTSMPMRMIHPHQLEHLRRVIRYGGVAFLIIRFTYYDQTFYVPAAVMLAEYDAGVKTIKHEWFTTNGFLIPYRYLAPVDYLSVIDQLKLEDKLQ